MTSDKEVKTKHTLYKVFNNQTDLLSPCIHLRLTNLTSIGLLP